MNKFLQQIILENTVQDYLIVSAIICIVFLFKKFIAHYLASLIFLLLQKRYKNIDKASFKHLVAKPLGLFVAVLITVATLDKLHYPQQLDFNIYHLKLRDLLLMLGTALLIIAFFRFLIKSMDFVMLLIKERYLQSGEAGNHQLVFFFKDFIKVLIGLIGGIMILKYSFHYDVKGLVTGLSIVGAAIALALKESLENLIASFIIFFDKPFETGDSVKVNNVSGAVEKIGLRSTRIRTDAKTYITVPNKQMVDSILDNLSNRTQRRADLRLEIEIDTNPAKVQQLLDGIKVILSNSEIQNFNVLLNDILPESLLVTAEYYTEPFSIAHFNSLKQTVNLAALQLMEKLGIDAAGKAKNIIILNQSQQEANQ